MWKSENEIIVMYNLNNWKICIRHISTWTRRDDLNRLYYTYNIYGNDKKQRWKIDRVHGRWKYTVTAELNLILW